jgi:hypothetical protein
MANISFSSSSLLIDLYSQLHGKPSFIVIKPWILRIDREAGYVYCFSQFYREEEKLTGQREGAQDIFTIETFWLMGSLFDSENIPYRRFVMRDF